MFSDNDRRPQVPVKKMIALIFSAVIIFVVVIFSGSLFESMDADEIMVVQSPVKGHLTFYVEDPGLKWQGFGKVTKYQRRSQYWFSAKDDQGADVNQSIAVRFNDGGHGTISGSIAWELPLDIESLTAVHRKYHSQHAVEQELVRPVVEKSVYMTGPMMSSRESFAERRNELIFFIEDQIHNGVYDTETSETKVEDPLSGQMKTVNTVIVVQKDGVVQRQDSSPLEEFNIRTFNLSLNGVDYDGTVESQIQAQQQAIMDVQTATAEAKKAEQDAITAEKKGEAEAAKAKWAQEVIKAKAVTEAEQKLEVARLSAQAAEQYKREQILKGEGDAEYKKLVMTADGALEQKLAAIITINQAYATAIQNHSGPWVPSVVMGEGGSTPGGAALPLIDLLTAQTAKQLGLDMQVRAGATK